ncbi:MAG TPA: adenosylmethionine--8-amino-7-oxononanoate transaminase [Sphingomicrobium sp.]|nr:adenosylmethionine--8-amino-7-oxononanoate transaminase [Sphingomicrobium sp.]
MSSQVWHPFTQHGLHEPIPIVERSEGAALYTADGRRIVDAISSWWVTTHGHRHPRIMQAIADQVGHLDQIIFAGWTHEPAERLARELLKMMPDGLDHVFYSDSGSTSVEVALKMAIGFWRNRGEPRERIIVVEGSYHGDTVGGMSVGARGVFNQTYSPFLFDVDTIPFPSEGHEQGTIDALESLCRRSRPAGLIVEPLIQGAGGMRIYPAATLHEMRKLCAAHGVLFIADEVMTGWGRTGTLLACEQAEIAPDLLCLSKGLTGGSLPLAVTLASSEIYEAHYSSDRSRMFFHSSSYAANPIACAAALANLEVWREEPVGQRIASLAHRQELRASRLGKASNLRQLGTIIACEIGDNRSGYLSKRAPELLAFFAQRDVLIRPLGNTIYVMPPYCIDDADLDRVFGSIEEALEQSRR